MASGTEIDPQFRLLDALTDGIVAADSSGRIMYANAAVESVLGWRPDDLVGEMVTVLTPPRFRGAHLTAFNRYFETHRPTIMGRAIQVAALRADGSEIAIDLGLSAVMLDGQDAVLASLHPTPDRETLTHDHEQLRFQLDFMAAITASLGEGVYSLDQAGKLTFINPAGERMLGWTERELLGRNIHDIIHFRRPDGTPLHHNECPLLQVTRTGTIYHGEDDIFFRKDGTAIPVVYTSAPIITNDEIVGAVLSFYDRTAERELEEQKDFLLSALAHDLKTPLTSIKGFAQLLLRKAERTETVAAADITPQLGRIDATTRRLAALVDELMDLTHIQMGREIDLVKRPVDLVEIVQQVVAEQQDHGEQRRIQVQAAVPSLTGQWDAARLNRVLTNLLSNAIKYSPEASPISVTVSRGSGAHGEDAILAISDNGIGIPEADLPHVFDRFHRAKNVPGSIPGTGIGLATVRHIVESHGGTIEIQSGDGAGTTVTVRLPTDPPDSPPA